MAKHSVKSLALTALIITSACFPLFSIVSRLVNQGFAPLTQVYLRIGLGFLLTLPILGRQIRWKLFTEISFKDWFALLLMGVVGYSLSTFFTTIGVLHTSLVNTSLIGNTEPFFVYLYAYFVFRQSIKINVLLFILLSIFGVTMIATNSFFPEFSAFGIGEVYVLLYAATSATYIIGRQLLSDKLNNSEITLLTMFIAVATTFLIAISVHEPFVFHNLLQGNILFGLLLGGILNLVVIVLQNFAYKHLEGVLASQILLISTLFALLYGYLWYNESLTIPGIAGGVLLLGGVYLTNRAAS